MTANVIFCIHLREQSYSVFRRILYSVFSADNIMGEERKSKMTRNDIKPKIYDVRRPKCEKSKVRKDFGTKCQKVEMTFD